MPDAIFVINAGGGTDDGTNPTDGAISDVNNSGSSGGSYEISTGGSSGGLAEILTNNSNALVNALKETSTAQINQVKSDSTNLIQAITSGNLLKELAMNKITSEMEKHGLNAKDYFDKKGEYLDYAKNGDSKIKDSQGKVVSPREVEALHNAEKAIETKAMNETDFVEQTNGIMNSMENSGTPSDEDDIDYNIMVSSLQEMFSLDNIDFNNLPKNLQEGV